MKPIPYTPSGSSTTSDPAIHRIPRVRRTSSPPHRPRPSPVLSVASSSFSHLPVHSAVPPNAPCRSPPCCCLHPLLVTVPSTASPKSATHLPVPSHHSRPPAFPFSRLFCQTLHADRRLAAAFTCCRRPCHLPPRSHPPLVIFILPLILSSFASSASVSFPFPSSSSSVHLCRPKPWNSGLLHLATSVNSLRLAQRAHVRTFTIGLFRHPILSSILIFAYS